MADLTAPDRNAYWGGLVDALRKIRSSVANVPEPEIKNLAVPDSWSAKDILNEGVLPSEDSIGEYENYAYGNYPIEQNPRTGLPRFKSDREGSRAGRAVGAAADLPLAAVTTPAKALGLAAGKASPAILAAIKKAAFKGMDVADYDRRINLAEEILAKGGSHQDVWDTVKLTEGYRPGIEGLDPWKGKWSTEFSPTEAMRQGEFFNPKHRMDKTEQSRYLQQVFPSHLQHLIPRYLNEEMPRPGVYKLGDLIPEHPFIKASDAAGDIEAQIFQRDLPGRSLAQYRPGEGEIELGKINPRDPGTPIENLSHEIAHASQNFFGGPPGTNSDVFKLFNDPQNRGLAGILLNNALQDTPERRAIVKALRPLQDVPRPDISGTQHIPSQSHYWNEGGEQLARLTEARDSMSKPLYADVDPRHMYDNPKEMIDSRQAENFIALLKQYQGRDPSQIRPTDVMNDRMWRYVLDPKHYR